MKTPEIIAVTLSNRDTALFVNTDAILQMDASEAGQSPTEVGKYLAAALGTVCHEIAMDVPTDREWSWNDVYELLPPTPPVSDATVPTLVLDINGGVINQIQSSEPVRVIVLDQDTEGGDPDNLMEVNGETLYVTDYLLVENDPDFQTVSPERVARIAAIVDNM